jgi:tetratricopeptide (TPR) repeat protein
MAQNKKTNVENPQELENFENAVLSSEAFIEKYQKQLMIAFVVIITLIAGWLVYKNLVQEPANQEAEALIVEGQLYFAANQYQMALDGDSINYIGFVAIADEYGSTPSGNLANAYAGISYYKLGDYDNAIAYLSNYSGDDAIVGYSVLGTIGDSYVQKGETESALSYFEKAAKSDNVMVATTYLLKLARAYESLNQNGKALATYQTIKTQYKDVLPGIADVDDVDKFINALSK